MLSWKNNLGYFCRTNAAISGRVKEEVLIVCCTKDRRAPQPGYKLGLGKGSVLTQKGWVSLTRLTRVLLMCHVQ